MGVSGLCTPMSVPASSNSVTRRIAKRIWSAQYTVVTEELDMAQTIFQVVSRRLLEARSVSTSQHAPPVPLRCVM